MTLLNGTLESVACSAPLQKCSRGTPCESGATRASTATLSCGTPSEAKEAFLQQHGDQYGYNGWMQQHWQAEVGNRIGQGQHYLDYTGAAQYTNSMITSVMSELTSTCFGNPHSRNPSSARATQEVNLARSLVLQHFSADPDQYHVIFTKGATEGLKMVGEFFPWSSSSPTSSTESPSHYVYTQANHKSVLGIGAYAKKAGAQLHCLGRSQMDQWLSSSGGPMPSEPPISRSNSSRLVRRASIIANNGNLATGLPDTIQLPPITAGQVSQFDAAGNEIPLVPTAKVDSSSIEGDSSSNRRRQSDLPLGGGDCTSQAPTFHLVAFPAKDNYEGQLYPLQWIEQVHAKSDDQNSYLVVLDAAAYAATHSLDLSKVQPDFVPLSFYKLFGYPTGLGALLVRKEAARQLNKVYFGGGSVDYCTAEDVWHVLSAPPAGLEDGTLGYLNIAALKYGFEVLKSLGGMKAITSHVESLRQWTYQQLTTLQHSNGRPLIKLFGRHAEGPSQQCGIFQFQVLTAEGDRLPGQLVEAAATAAGLHLRTGCNCNPGRCLANLGITPEEERARAAQGHKGPVLVVMRPRMLSVSGGRLQYSIHSGIHNSINPTSNSSNNAKPDSYISNSVSDCQSGRPLVPVPLPLGSVRASLGAMSTFEDCYALVRFLALTFRDFKVSDHDVDTGMKLVSVFNDTEKVVEVCADVTSSAVDQSDDGDDVGDDQSEDGVVQNDDNDGLLLYSMLAWAS